MADGIVNGCGVKDPEASLRIGDLNEKPLREIISTRNPAYMQLIEEQQKGSFVGSAKIAITTRASTTYVRFIGKASCKLSQSPSSRRGSIQSRPRRSQ